MIETTNVIVILASVLATFITTWIINNTKLKEGITDKFLSMVGKFGSRKIDLKNHKAFIIVKNYENHLNLFLFNGHTKSVFYKEFIGIIFKHITQMMEDVISNFQSNNIKENVEFYIVEKLELARKSINEEIEEKLNIPIKIQNQIDHWKSLMLNSLRSTIEQLITDDSNDEGYFKVYRTLDAILTTANFITGTGSILFNNINGAFDEITIENIYKNKNAGKRDS